MGIRVGKDLLSIAHCCAQVAESYYCQFQFLQAVSQITEAINISEW